MKTKYLLGLMMILFASLSQPSYGNDNDGQVKTEYSIDVQQPIQMEMNSLLEYRELSYFERNKDAQFLVKTAAGYRVTNIINQQSNWWFNFDGYKIKCISAESISFKQLQGTPVRLKDDNRLYGRITSFGLNNTDIVHVYWDYNMKDYGRITSAPRPYGFNRLYNLIRA